MIGSHVGWYIQGS